MFPWVRQRDSPDSQEQIALLTWQFLSEDIFADEIFAPSVRLIPVLLFLLIKEAKKGRTWMNLIQIFCPLRIKSDNGISFCRGKTVREKDWTVCSSKWHFSMSFMHLLKGQYLITDKILRLRCPKQTNLSLPSLCTLTLGFFRIKAK